MSCEISKPLLVIYCHAIPKNQTNSLDSDLNIPLALAALATGASVTAGGAGGAGGAAEPFAFPLTPGISSRAGGGVALTTGSAVACLMAPARCSGKSTATARATEETARVEKR